jgi:hypothetical protein
MRAPFPWAGSFGRLAGHVTGIFYGEVGRVFSEEISNRDIHALVNPDKVDGEVVRQIRESFGAFVKRVEEKGGRADLAQLADTWAAGEVRYISDIRQHGRFEHFPTVEEVWRTGKDDCDGRAVLAVCAMRSLGHSEARVHLSRRHAQSGWARKGVDGGESAEVRGGGVVTGVASAGTNEVWPERIAGVPWGRMMVFLALYWAMEYFLFWRGGRRVTRRTNALIGALAFWFVSMEIYSQHFLWNLRHADQQTAREIAGRSAGID